MYANARIDGAVVEALTIGSNDRFRKEACISAIHRTRTAAIQGRQPEPSLRETAALLDNDTVLDGLFEAAAARTAGTEFQQYGLAGRQWLHHDWRGLNQRLQNAIRDCIRHAGASRLTVRALLLSPAPTTIRDRRGNSATHNGLLL